MGEVSLQLKHIEATPITLDCSYCGERMWYSQVKKLIPSGAKDLEIYEGTWQCGECGQTSRDFIVNCNMCGRDVVDFEDDGDFAENRKKLSERLMDATYPAGKQAIFGYFRETGNFSDQPYPAQCLNCVTCEECNRKIDFGPDGRDRIPRIAAIDWDDRFYKYFYFHRDCLEKSHVYRDYQEQKNKARTSVNKGNKSGCASGLTGILGLLLLLLLVGSTLLF